MDIEFYFHKNNFSDIFVYCNKFWKKKVFLTTQQWTLEKSSEFIRKLCFSFVFLVVGHRPRQRTKVSLVLLVPCVAKGSSRNRLFPPRRPCPYSVVQSNRAFTQQHQHCFALYTIRTAQRQHYSMLVELSINIAQHQHVHLALLSYQFLPVAQD